MERHDGPFLNGANGHLDMGGEVEVSESAAQMIHDLSDGELRGLLHLFLSEWKRRLKDGAMSVN
jgi:hypothetical protein